MQFSSKVPEGAVRVHWGSYTRGLAPRGSMAKESLSAYINERLLGVYDSFTDDSYGDNPDPDELVESLREQLEMEVEDAFNAFMTEVTGVVAAGHEFRCGITRG